MTTTMANDKQQPGPVNADELFMKLSVPELNVYERRTRYAWTLEGAMSAQMEAISRRNLPSERDEEARP